MKETIGRRARSREPGVRELLSLARSRAYARLSDAIRFPLTLVVAPGGFGKSTVVRDLLRAQGQAYRRLKIAPGNSDMLGVLRGLAACVGDLAPALASTFVTVYDRLAEAPDAPEQLAHWAAEYLLSAQALIVVDGFQAQCDNRGAALIAALIDRTRPGLKWIVVAETGDGFPIARWLAQACMDLPVDAGDLALRDDDLSYAFGDLYDSHTRRQFREVCRLTAGWPGAIVLALAARHVLAMHRAPRAPEALYDYLANAVLATLAQPTRAFIEQTCLYSSFTRGFLEGAGFSDIGRILEELCAAVGVLSMDADGSYEFNPDFRAFVIAELGTRGDGTLALVAARSAAAYERAGCYSAAIDIYIAQGDQDALCSLLTQHGYTLIDVGESNAVQRALAAVPHEILLTFPGALAVKASLESLHGKIDVAEAWFRLALERIANESQRYDVTYRFATDLVRRERPDALELLEPLVATLDEASPLAAPLLALLASAYASVRQLAQASLAIERALQLLPSVQSPAMRAKIRCQAGFVALHLRHITAAKALATQAYLESTAIYSYDVAARALSILYNISIDYEDDVAACRSYVTQLAAASERAGSRQLLLYATLCGYELEAYAGNAAEIEVLGEQLASLEVFYSVLTTETLLPSQALQASWTGDFYRAYRILESSAEHQITSDRRAHRYAEIAVYAAAAGLREEAAAAAKNALICIRQTPWVDKTIVTAQAYVTLTFILLRQTRRAERSLRALARRREHTPRVALLVQAVDALAQRWRVRSARPALAQLLEALEAADLGGIARMIEALPLPQSASGSGARHKPAHAHSGASVVSHAAKLCRKLGCRCRRRAAAIAAPGRLCVLEERTA